MQNLKKEKKKKKVWLPNGITKGDSSARKSQKLYF